MTKQPDLSVCMIVKDEEKMIMGALRNACRYANQVIVVDTGSTDRTVQIVNEFIQCFHPPGKYFNPVSLFHYDWQEDFAAARNFSLDQATGDWILVLDADEFVMTDPTLVKQLIAEPTDRLTGYLSRIVNLADDDRDVTEHYMLRLFPNHPGLRYVNKIHEQINPSVPFQQLMVKDLVIEHHGYKTEIANAKNKQDRNLHLITQSVEEDPDNAYHWFNLGLTYRGTNKPYAIVALQRCIELAGDNPPDYIAVAYTILAALWMELETPVSEVHAFEALEVLMNGSPLNIYKNPDWYMLFGNVQIELKHYESAESYYLFALALKDNQMIVKDGGLEWKCYAGLAMANVMQEKYEHAYFWYQRAIELAPKHIGLIEMAGRMSLLMGFPDHAKEWIERIKCHDDHDEALLHRLQEHVDHFATHRHDDCMHKARRAVNLYSKTYNELEQWDLDRLFEFRDEVAEHHPELAGIFLPGEILSKLAAMQGV